MSTDRRGFLGAVVGAGLVIGRKHSSTSTPHPVPASDWDVSWTAKVAGTHRAVFDSPEVSEGLGLLRALVWIKDYGEVYGATLAEMSAVVVLRHNAIWMVMNDQFWAQHGVGSITKITDPRTKLPIKRNPFLGATPFPDLPHEAADNVLTRALAATTVLACNLAFQDVVDRVKVRAGNDDATARAMALEHLVPGIILQPSGVFAVTRAQEAGCQYMLAS